MVLTWISGRTAVFAVRREQGYFVKSLRYERWSRPGRPVGLVLTLRCLVQQMYLPRSTLNVRTKSRTTSSNPPYPHIELGVPKRQVVHSANKTTSGTEGGASGDVDTNAQEKTRAAFVGRYASGLPFSISQWRRSAGETRGLGGECRTSCVWALMRSFLAREGKGV